MSLDQALIAEALRPKAPALPQALAAAEAAAVIERASFCAPEFVDVEPALDAPMAFGWDNTTPPPPVPARSEVAKSDTGNRGSVETPTAEPAPKTGLHGRPIITLKKSRKVVSK